jgi:hypothetical protein
MQNETVPLPSHGQIMAGPSPHNTESTCQVEKAWRHTIRHGAPLHLHVFLAVYNDFSFSPSQNHAFCIVSCPRVFILQRIVFYNDCSTCVYVLGIMIFEWFYLLGYHFYGAF